MFNINLFLLGCKYCYLKQNIIQNLNTRGLLKLFLLNLTSFLNLLFWYLASQLKPHPVFVQIQIQRIENLFSMDIIKRLYFYEINLKPDMNFNFRVEDL